MLSAITRMCGSARDHPARGFDPVQLGHRDVHHDDIGTQLRGEFHGFPSIGGLADNLHVGLRAQDHFEALPDYGMVVNQQDASAFHGGAVPELQLEHPRPRGECTLTSPPALRARARIPIRPRPRPAAAGAPFKPRPSS